MFLSSGIYSTYILQLYSIFWNVLIITHHHSSGVTGIYESILDTDHLLMQASSLQPGQELRPPLPVDIIGGVG